MLNTSWILSFLAFFLLTPTLWSRVDSSKNWKTLETDHFYIIHEDRQKDLALEYAKASELSYDILKNIFSEMPDKTTLVIMDNTDETNGFATFLPYPYITVFPVLPNSLGTVSNYGHWPFGLTLHEYTHILNLTPAHGIYTPFKYLIGTIVRPNALLPRWYLEGLAVATETYYTPYGRLSSPYSFAALRTLSESDTLKNETIDRINETSITDWPFGQRPYLLGSLVWNEMLDNNSMDVIDSLNQRFSRRVPFLLKAPSKELTGATFDDHLKSIYSKIQEKSKNQVEKIKEKGDEPALAFDHSGTGQLSPTISPNGKLMAYVSSELYKGGQIRLVERENPETESFLKRKYKILKYGKGFSGLSWLPDSSGFIFDKLDTFKRYHFYGDLYHYDIKEEKTNRLTWGERASEPAVSPSGQIVAFIKKDSARTMLAVYRFEPQSNEGKVEVLYKAPNLVRLSRPNFQNENEIILAARRKSGKENLFKYNLKTKKMKILLKPFTHAGQPRQTKKGLIFTSTKTGVTNLYLANNDLTDAKAVTNTTTRIINGDWDSWQNELITSRLTHTGWKLYSTKNPKTYSLAQIEAPWNIHRSKSVKSPSSFQVKTQKMEDYSSLRYLVPRYWIPFIYAVDGGVLFQGSTSTGDPLGKHSYLLQGSYDTVTEKGSYGLSYTNSTTPIDLSLSYAETSYLTGSNEILTSRFGGLFSSFYFPGLNNHWRGSLGGSYNETTVTTTSGPVPLKRDGPSASFSYSNFSDEEPYPFLGGKQAFTLGATKYLKKDNFLEYDQYNMKFSYQLKQPFPSRHSIFLNIQSTLSPRLPVGLTPYIGSTTLGGNFLATLINSTNIVRGYPSGEFVGKKLVNTNLEYQFPISDYYSGKSTHAIFLRTLTGAVFVDAVAVDGAFINKNKDYERTHLERVFAGTGAEVKLNVTLAYHLPISFILGGYYGFDQAANGGFTTFLGIGINGVSGFGEQNKNATLQ